MKKPHFALLSAILLVMYFGLVLVTEFFDLRRNNALNVLDPYLYGKTTQDLQQRYRNLKRRVILDKGRVEDSVAVLEFSLRHWQSLDKNDREFCRKTLNRMIRSINRRQFERILDAWQASCNDITLFPEALKKNPVYYRHLADRLINTEDEIKLRNNLMTNFEIFWLESVNRVAQQLSLQSSTYSQWKNLRSQLKRGIQGYFRLSEKSGLLDERYSHLLKRIHLSILGSLLDTPGWIEEPGLSNEVNGAIAAYLNDFGKPEDAGELRKFLQRAKFFQLEPLWVFRVQEQIQLAAGHYPQVIRDCEALLEKPGVCPTEEVKECIQLMLLLTDAHIASHLLSSAIPVLAEAEKMEPGRLDVGWRLFQVHRIIGIEDTLLAAMQQRFQQIAHSHVLEVSSPVQRQAVFILDRQELELRISSRLASQVVNPHMIQVMIDGCVVSEIPLSGLHDRTSIPLPLECRRFSRHNVVVTVM
jgi:hypothetical protein